MTLEEIDTEIVELSNQITILDRQIANMKLSGETNTLSYRRNLIAVKAARQLKNALQQDRRRLANEQGVKKAQEIKVPTFNTTPTLDLI